jgi:hypothetical protein
VPHTKEEAMANISREEDRRDFEDRIRNGGHRSSGPAVESPEEYRRRRIMETEQEVRNGLAELRTMAKKSGKRGTRKTKY